MNNIEFHPLADIFPMMSAEEFIALKTDIAKHGLREPIILARGKIADGRNRYNACMELDIEPSYEEWDGVGSLVALIVSMNLHRRHLNESQRAMVAAKLANMEKGRPTKNTSIDVFSQPEAAQTLNVSLPSVQRAKKVLTEGTPELAQAVERGKVAVSVAAKVAEMPKEQQDVVMERVGEGKSAKAAMREVGHAEKRAQPFPKGKYQVIYADPPWKYDNSGFDEAADAQYPTMTVEEISLLHVEDLTTDASVLFLWATNPLLPKALEVMQAWGFIDKTNMAWIKDKARGKGWWLKSKHELLLIGVRKETPLPEIRPPSAFEADRGPVHSRKPERAYEIIEGMYPQGARVELFSRNVRNGWEMWGNENAKPKRK